MENYLTQIINYLLTQSWQIAVLVVVIAVASLALKNKSAHVRYLLWLIILAKCLVPPLLTIPLAVLPERGPTAAFEPVAAHPVEPAVVPAAPVAVVPEVIAVRQTRKLTPRQWLGFGWIVGVAAFLLFALIKALRTNSWLRRQRKPLPAELQIGIKNLFSGLGFKTFPKVWLVEGIGQPFVWGLLRGSIYLPANFVNVDNAEHRGDVLGHELSHILRFDAAVNILQVVAQAIFWFHPFVWWANRKIRAEREKCCDEMAIARLGAKAKDYSSAIVNILIAEHESTRPVPSLAVAGPVKNIEERIKTMMRPGKKFYKRPSAIVVITILLLAALAVPTTLALTKRESDPRTPTAQSANLEVLDVKFEPIRQGKNVVNVEVKNNSEEDQMFRIQIYTRSPDVGGWGTSFFDTIKAGETKWTRHGCKIRGPITDGTYIRLDFHNPGPAASFDMEKWKQKIGRTDWFKRVRYDSSDLEHYKADGSQIKPASKGEADAVIKTLRQVQDHIKNKEYEAAWSLFTQDFREAEFASIGFEGFKQQMESPVRYSLSRIELLALEPKSVTRQNNVFVLAAAMRDKLWTVDFVQDGGQYKLDSIGGLISNDWQERFLPLLETRTTKHFDIYYLKDSTAEKEITQIVKEKEKGFEQICQFLGKDSDVRIRMVFFEDGETKRRATGHQGMGWAFGNTIVEVYNEKEKLDPYHETTHILMHPYGNPPALFNEGFAVYMSERLGAHALKNLGGGLATIHQRAGGLKEQGQWIDLEELVTYTEIGSRESQPPISYAEAASFVKFLIDKYGKDKFLRAYKALKNSNDRRVHRQNLETLADIYGKSLQQLEKPWQGTLVASPGANSIPRGVPEDANAAIKIEARLLLVSSDAREVEDFLERENLESSQIQGDPNSRSYLLNAEQVEQLLELVRLNAEYKFLMNPTLEVLDGKTGMVSSSHRFNYISGYSEPNLPSEVPKPIQDSVDIGDRLQLKPKLRPNSHDTMEVYFEFEISKLTGYEKYMYKGKYPYEIPIIEKIAVAAHYIVAADETMLLCGWKITDRVDRTKKNELLVLITTQKVEPKNAKDAPEIVEVRYKNGAKE